MPKKKKIQLLDKVSLSFITTVIIVAGVAFAGYVYYGKKIPAINAPEATNLAGLSEESSELPFSLLMPNEFAVSILSPDRKMERLTFLEFNDKYKDESLPIYGVLAANGETRYLHLPIDATATASWYIAPDGMSSAWLDSPAKDEASIIEVKKGQAKEEKIVLRTSKNKPIKDAMLLGWFDEKTIVVVASVDQVKSVYAVNLNGVVRQVKELPENIIFYVVKSGYFWFATGTLGEGLESSPTGPSELYRVSSNGVFDLVARDEKNVFISMTADSSGNLGATMSDGNSFVMRIGSDGSRIDIGKRRPLLFTDNDKLIVRDGFDLLLMDCTSGDMSKIVSLPEGSVEIFVLNK
ncbi:MAG: hypothetical protein ABIB04_04905 [Patescibacteria group bacterium]